MATNIKAATDNRFWCGANAGHIKSLRSWPHHKDAALQISTGADLINNHILKGQTLSSEFGGTYVIRVPQSSPPSPHLYLIFTSNLPRTDKTDICLYADDTVTLTKAYRKPKISSWLQKRLKNTSCGVNMENSSQFRENASHNVREKDKAFGNKLFCNGVDIEWSFKGKYLEVYFNKKLT